MLLAAINLHRRLLNASNDVYGGEDINNESSTSDDFDFLHATLTLAEFYAPILVIVVLAWLIAKICFFSGEVTAEMGAEAAAEAAAARKKRELRHLPLTMYKSGRDVEGGECTICLANFVDGEKIRVLPQCNHRFHARCIDEWLVTKTSCPNCRISLLQPSYHVINMSN